RIEKYLICLEKVADTDEGQRCARAWELFDNYKQESLKGDKSDKKGQRMGKDMFIINGGVFNVAFMPKRTNQEKEQNLMDHYSIPDHKEVIMENVDNKDAYTKNIQQSHENVMEEVCSKIQCIKCPQFKSV
ncbi:19852_t:CDS:2, partial [Entrophospora sp. SA101]